MRPRIILHNAIGADGSIDGFMSDIKLFYETAGSFQEDATLAGNDALLAAFIDETGGEVRRTDSAGSRPLLVVPDSRGHIHDWPTLRRAPLPARVAVLCSRATPDEYLDSLRELNIDYVVTEDDRVDLPAALDELTALYDIKVVRVESSGTLNGALLSLGLVDEVSFLLSPCLVGSETVRTMFRSQATGKFPDPIPLQLTHLERDAR